MKFQPKEVQPIAVYKGWNIYYFEFSPVTGKYVAERFGVQMNTNSKDSLCKMIDQRIKEYPPKGD